MRWFTRRCWSLLNDGGPKESTAWAPSDEALEQALGYLYGDPPPAERVDTYLEGRRQWQRAADQRLRLHLQQTMPAHVRNARPQRRLSRRLGAVTLMVTAAIVGVGAAVALNSVTNLGPPSDTQSTASYFPLSGFHRIGLNLRRDGKPEVLFIGVKGDTERIGAERWPVVKALNQFGVLTGVTAVDRRCVTIKGGPQNREPYCTNPTFDFTHARYSSRYLTFVSKDLARLAGNVYVPFQPLTKQERYLYEKYARYRGHGQCASRTKGGSYVLHPCTSFSDIVAAAITNIQGTRTLPIVVIGDYLQTVSEVVFPSDFTQTIPQTPPPGSAMLSNDRVLGLSFQAAQGALIHGRDPQFSKFVEDVNAETNIITALICHADGNRPMKVCGRPVIDAILRHVK